ncbi:hypothetical protein, partial [Salmonella enterica]|uniref:hypothetical protein n=1 Tax=Salmonella enterica TaxID=28901 RepID=UPI003EDC6691
MLSVLASGGRSLEAGEPFLTQEYTEDTDVTLTKFSSGRGQREGVWVGRARVGVWLTAGLVSFKSCGVDRS